MLLLDSRRSREKRDDMQHNGVEPQLLRLNGMCHRYINQLVKKKAEKGCKEKKYMEKYKDKQKIHNIFNIGYAIIL